MSNVLIERLSSELNYPKITAKNHDAFMNDSGPATSVLFFTGNAATNPETLDVAVVLPELIHAFSGQLLPGVVDDEAEASLPVSYDINSYPALVFIKQGITVGTISRIQDWQDYLTEIQTILTRNAHITHVIPTMTQESENGR